MRVAFKTTMMIPMQLLICSAALAQDQTHSHPMSEIVITADPLRPGILEYGTAASVVDRDVVLLRGKSSLGETLSSEPGVSSTYFGPGASRPVIRGNSGERVRVLQNGVGTFDVSNLSEDHAVTVDPYSIEQVEVLRGPETLFYGSNAIGGLVNVYDDSIAEKAVGAPAKGELDYRMGTGDDEISGAAKLKGELGKFNWNISGFSRNTHDVDIPGFAESAGLRAGEAAEGGEHEEEEAYGTLPNTATRTRGATVGGSYVWDKGFVGASVSTFHSRYGVPGHVHVEGHSDEEGPHEEEHADHHDNELLHEDSGSHVVSHALGEEAGHSEEEAGVAIDMEQVRMDVRGEVRDVSSLIDRVRVRGGISNYDHKELEGAEVGTVFENNAGEARIEAVHTEQAGLRGAAGLQFQGSDFSSKGEEAFVPPNTVIAPAVFLYEEYKLNKQWKLQAGGRSEYTQIDPDGLPTKEFFPFGLSTGAIFDPAGNNEHTVGLSVAYTQRAPAATELFADGAHIARQIVERGDSTLGEEASWGTDLTFKRNYGIVTGALNFFYQQYDDYINLSATGEEDGGFPVFSYENIRARFWGAEAESTLHVHELLGWYEHEVDLGAQVDLVRAKNLSDSDDIPRIPPLRTQLRASYHWKRAWGAHVEGVFVEDQERLADFELPTDSYQLLNAAVEYTLPATPNSQLTLYAQGFNLTDEEARVHASFLKDQAPLPGQSILFGVRGTF